MSAGRWGLGLVTGGWGIESGVEREMVDDAVVNNKTLGERGESIAVAFLKGQKFAIVERNFRCKAGEVDIVAREGKTLVFVEVKTRRTPSCGPPQLPSRRSSKGRFPRRP